MFCSVCGQRNEGGDRFCSACGSSLNASDSSTFNDKTGEEKAREIKYALSKQSKEGALIAFFLLKPLFRYEIISSIIVVFLIIMFWGEIEGGYKDYRATKKIEKEKSNENSERLSISKKAAYNGYPRGTFIDVDARLMWQDDKNTTGWDTRKNWYDANQYCSSLKLGDYQDWRLPSEEELKSLHKKQKLLINLLKNTYWSRGENYKDEAYNLLFDCENPGCFIDDGYYYDKNNNNRSVRCVRGGE